MHQVPYLRSGIGDNPSEGGCILQVIDWISSGGWTDHPLCVHPFLREIAIEVNDRLEDDERQKLLDLIPRLMQTNDPLLEEDIRATMSRGLLQATLEGRFWGYPRFDEEDDEFLDGYGYTIKGLKAAIDDYDELTGRTRQSEQVDFSGVCAILGKSFVKTVA